MTSLRRSCYEARVLPDGSYDVFVVDAAVDGDQTTLELTIIAGEHKGEMVSLSAKGIGRDETDLLGMPGTLTVENGVPSVRFDE